MGSNLTGRTACHSHQGVQSSTAPAVHRHRPQLLPLRCRLLELGWVQASATPTLAKQHVGSLQFTGVRGGLTRIV